MVGPYFFVALFIGAPVILRLRAEFYFLFIGINLKALNCNTGTKTSEQPAEIPISKTNLAYAFLKAIIWRENLRQ